MNSLPMSAAKILIVEDHLIAAQRLSSNLSKVGYEITDKVPSGKGAIQSVETNKPDIIIMDITLEGDMDGITAAKIINKSHKIPIIFVTDHTDELVVMRAQKTKPANYISKPYQLTQLHIAISRALFEVSDSAKKSSKTKLLNNKQDKAQSKDFTDVIHKVKKNIFVRERIVFEKVKLKDVLWLEADRAYFYLVTKKKVYNLATNMSSFIKKVPHKNFFQTHRSFIVNLKNIDAISGHKVKIKHAEKVPNLSSMSNIRCKDGWVPVSKKNMGDLADQFTML